MTVIRVSGASGVTAIVIEMAAEIGTETESEESAAEIGRESGSGLGGNEMAKCQMMMTQGALKAKVVALMAV